jgi:predicted DNA-binding protein
MKNPKKAPVLVDTLSCRFPRDVFMRLAAASKQQRRTLSDYVRLLVEQAEREQHGA